MNQQMPVELIPEGFYCYQIIKCQFENKTAVVKICPYIVLDKENNIKKCRFLDNIEILDIKECQINLGVV
ncbi:MAG TPA: hypothetical protein DDW90_08165 [Cyanobacteria bacterium UBA9971]|nr:hypothetical protein [Cyanobacteria bacterium UBA9971]HCR36147.1 hypothetical protein [Candidatus Woesebacteria bacterium]